MMPDIVRLTVDRRLLRGEESATERSQIEEALRGALSDEVGLSVSQLPIEFAATDGRGSGHLGTVLRQAVGLTTGTVPEPWGTPYSSDMRVLVGDGGMEAVTIGPGSISQAHAPDEHVSLAQVRDAASSMFTAALTLLGDRS